MILLIITAYQKFGYQGEFIDSEKHFSGWK